VPATDHAGEVLDVRALRLEWLFEVGMREVEQHTVGEEDSRREAIMPMLRSLTLLRMLR
jgi:hypothetical protein